MDITYFEHITPTGGPVRSTDAICPTWLAQRARGEVKTEKVTLHLEVGTPVLVRAYGRLRVGEVTKLGRTKVRVLFVRNQSGETDERSFGPFELYPRLDGESTRTPTTRQEV